MSAEKLTSVGIGFEAPGVIHAYSHEQMTRLVIARKTKVLVIFIIYRFLTKINEKRPQYGTEAFFR
jgi:hypothetical protein